MRGLKTRFKPDFLRLAGCFDDSEGALGVPSGVFASETLCRVSRLCLTPRQILCTLKPRPLPAP